MSKFDPNQVTFAEGEVRVQRVLKHAKVDISKRVMTSHDEDALRLKKLLPVTTVPDGFEKWQLPFIFDRGQFFISVGKGGQEVGESALSCQVPYCTRERSSKPATGCTFPRVLLTPSKSGRMARPWGTATSA